MYHSVLTKLSCFSSPWWLCCPVTTPPDHHHQNTHNEGGHKVSWLKDPSKNEQKHSRESWPGLRQNPEPYSFLCLHQGLWRRSILTARARQSLPVSAQNVWMPASVRWETCNLQSSKSQSCLHVWSVIHRRPSKICTPELPPRGSRRFLDLTVTRPAFHHFTIPPLAGASKLIPLTPTLYVSPSRPFQHSLVTKQSYLATNNQSWYCQHNSLTMLSSRTPDNSLEDNGRIFSHGLYQNVPRPQRRSDSHHSSPSVPML